MPTIEIPLGEFLPAQPTVKNPGLIVADNVLPAEGGYAPINGPVARPAMVTGTTVGAELMFRPDGSPFVVGGTTESLFAISGTAVNQQSDVTPVPADESWDFAQFNNFIFATSINNAPRYIIDYTVGNSFTTLPGNPPLAKYCEKFGEFLMLGNIDGAYSRIQWSSFNSPATSWTPNRLTQAGFADLNPRFGPVTALSGGRYPMVFQERAVWLVQYVGPPTVWNVSLVSEDRGCVAPFSVVTLGSQTYFLSQDGFWATNGSEFAPIGSQKVNRWFFDNADNTYLSTVQGTVDWRNKCIIWAFRTVRGGSSAPYDRAMIYSWEQNRFSTATINVDRLVGSRVAATTLEDLDALFTSLEDVTPDLDSVEWLAGDRVLAAFIQDGGSRYHIFNGPAMEANFETGAFQPMAGQRGFISEAQAVFDAQEWAMQASPIMQDNFRAERYGPFMSPGVSGAIPMRADGKELRLAVKCPEGMEWSRAVGVQLTFRPSGRR